MKKVIILLTAATTLLVAFHQPAGGIKIGDALPNAEQKLKDVTGNMVSFKEAIKEKGLLVMFSCNTCPYVIKNQTRTTAAIDAAAKLNIGAVVVNSNEAQRSDADSYAAMQQYAKAQGYVGKTFYVLDENSAQADAFGANRTPECYLFNKAGVLVYHGAIDDNPQDAGSVTRNHLQIAMEEMNAGKEITKTESRSVGCTIKRKG
jgi:thioredoxin-related protein